MEKFLVLGLLMVVCNVNATPPSLQHQNGSLTKMAWAHHVPWQNPSDIGFIATSYYSLPTLRPQYTTTACYQTEFAEAQKSGINGFFVDLIFNSTGISTYREFTDMVNSAAGTDFYVAACVDGVVTTSQLTDRIARIVNDFGTHPNYPKIDGKPIIATYGYKHYTPAQWQAALDGLSQQGIEIYLIANFEPTIITPFDQSLVDSYYGLFDAIYMFSGYGFRGDTEPVICGKLEDAADDNDADYMMCVWPGYLGGWYLEPNDFYQPFREFDQVLDCYATLNSTDPVWIHLTSWNDHHETAMQPTYYDTASQHINKYQIGRWKSGGLATEENGKVYVAYHHEKIPGSVLRIETLILPGNTSSETFNITCDLYDVYGNLKSTQSKTQTVYNYEKFNRFEMNFGTDWTWTPHALIPHVTVNGVTAILPPVFIKNGWIENQFTIRVPFDDFIESTTATPALTVTQSDYELNASVSLAGLIDSTDKVVHAELWRNNRPIGPMKVTIPTDPIGYFTMGLNQATKINATFTDAEVLSARRKSYAPSPWSGFGWTASTISSSHCATYYYPKMEIAAASTASMNLLFDDSVSYDVLIQDIIQKRNVTIFDDSIYETFSVPLTAAKWEHIDGNFAVADGEMTMVETGFYSPRYINSVETVSLNDVSESNPFEVSIDLSNVVYNQIDSTQNYVKLQLLDSSDNVVAGIMWGFEEEGVVCATKLYAGGIGGTAVMGPYYNFVGHSIGMRVTDAGVYYLVDGSVLESKFMAFPGGYSIPTEDLHIQVSLQGPNQGAEVSVDNLTIQQVVPDAVYEDFDAALAVGKWEYVDSNFTVASGEMTMVEAGFYSPRYIQSVEEFSLNNVSDSNPFEASIDLSSVVYNQVDSTQNYIWLKLLDSSDNVVAGVMWGFEEAGVVCATRLNAGGTNGTSVISQYYNFVGHSIGMRVTSAGVYYLVDGSVLENKFLAFPTGYSKPTEDLRLQVSFYGPNQGAELSVDNLTVNRVVPKSTEYITMYLNDCDNAVNEHPELSFTSGTLQLKLWSRPALETDTFYVRFETEKGKVFYSDIVTPFLPSTSSILTRVYITNRTLEYFTGVTGLSGRTGYFNTPTCLEASAERYLHPACFRSAEWNFDDGNLDTLGERDIYDSGRKISDIMSYLVPRGTGKCLQLDGQTKVRLRYRANPMTGCTIKFDINPDSGRTSDQVILGNSGFASRFLVNLKTDGKIEVSRKHLEGTDPSDTLVTTASVPDGTWSTVQIVFNERWISVYINGVRYAGNYVTELHRYGNSTTSIGAETDGFKGKIDNIIFYSRPVDP